MINLQIQMSPNKCRKIILPPVGRIRISTNCVRENLTLVTGFVICSKTSDSSDSEISSLYQVFNQLIKPGLFVKASISNGFIIPYSAGTPFDRVPRLIPSNGRHPRISEYLYDFQLHSSFFCSHRFQWR